MWWCCRPVRTHPIGEFTIDLPRPRDVAEIRNHARFVELHAAIWDVLREEVLKGYASSATRPEAAATTESEQSWHSAKTRRHAAHLAAAAPGGDPGIWHAATRSAAFFFGEPLVVAQRIWSWFVVERDIYLHLGVTLAETVLAFGIGTASGLGVGLWLALSRSPRPCSIPTSRPRIPCRA